MRPRVPAALVTGLAALALAAPVMAASPVGAQLAQLRAATDKYHDVSVAIADVCATRRM